MYIFGMPIPEWAAAADTNFNISLRDQPFFYVREHSIPTSDVIP
jgi:hypothetical protein